MERMDDSSSTSDQENESSQALTEFERLSLMRYLDENDLVVPNDIMTNEVEFRWEVVRGATHGNSLYSH